MEITTKLTSLTINGEQVYCDNETSVTDEDNVTVDCAGKMTRESSGYIEFDTATGNPLRIISNDE